MCGNLKNIIYYIIDSFCIENRYMIITYYVTLFVSFLINYLPHHNICLVGIHITT
jgi:hypothetical protein